MNNDELNPESPALTAARGQWHKICALLMHKQGLKEVTITMQDIGELAQSPDGMPYIVLHAKKFEFKLLLFKNADEANVYLLANPTITPQQ